MKNLVLLALACLTLACAPKAVRAGDIPDQAVSNTFTERCPDIVACAKVVSGLLNQQYVIDAGTVGRLAATPNVVLNAENAEVLFTLMLHLNGFSRVPLEIPRTYQIIRERDARDTNLPIVTASGKQAPSLPSTWDLYNLDYQLSHPEDAEQIARTLRSFLPGNSRVIPDELAGRLLVTTSAAELKTIYTRIQEMDVRPSAELTKKWAADRKLYEERTLREAAAPKVDASQAANTTAQQTQTHKK